MSFIPHQIDDDSGIGTQFAVADINGDGLLDVVTRNKKGVYVFEQVRGPAVKRPLQPERVNPHEPSDRRGPARTASKTTAFATLSATPAASSRRFMTPSTATAPSVTSWPATSRRPDSWPTAMRGPRGRPGVCLAVCGPGVFNAATPLATAFTDSVPSC